MHIEHVDAGIVGERGETDSGAAEGRDQRQFAGKFCGELLLVVGGRGPGLLLRGAVIVGGQFLDAGAKNLGQKRRDRSATSAAARALASRGGSSRDLPGGAVLGVFQHDAHFGEFVADAVGFLEVLHFARGIARFDQAGDLAFVDRNRRRPERRPLRGRCLATARSIAHSPSGRRPRALPPSPLRCAIRARRRVPSAY